MRAKYSSLLKNVEKEEEESEKEEEGDADITFIPGLKKNLNKALRRRSASR